MDEIKKYEVNLAKLDARPDINFNCGYSISYGTHGLSAVKHKYVNQRHTRFSVYDVYHNGVYLKSFSTKKATNKFLEEFDKRLGGNKQVNELFALTLINDEPSVMSVKVFDTREEARSQMETDVSTEEKSWNGNYTTHTNIEGDFASLSIEENDFHYIWNIDKVIKK